MNVCVRARRTYCARPWLDLVVIAASWNEGKQLGAFCVLDHTVLLANPRVVFYLLSLLLTCNWCIRTCFTLEILFPESPALSLLEWTRFYAHSFPTRRENCHFHLKKIYIRTGCPGYWFQFNHRKDTINYTGSLHPQLAPKERKKKKRYQEPSTHWPHRPGHSSATLRSPLSLQRKECQDGHPAAPALSHSLGAPLRPHPSGLQGNLTTVNLIVAEKGRRVATTSTEFLADWIPTCSAQVIMHSIMEFWSTIDCI